ncbi:MAG: hypothetical protein JAZ12_18720 [Candidatus Thiodiazotropha taylori]|nr:hypothetical protein [Candidatus Thiodiazotropha taylori]
MASEQKKNTADLPERYRQALDTVEAAGGTISDFALDLVAKAEQEGLSDSDIIEILKQHYQE